MTQMNLYCQTQLETKVTLLPGQINADMGGIVLKVNEIVDYDYGIIDKINFMGSTVYNVKYKCFFCAPIANLELICSVDNIVKGFLVGHNGPIIIVVQLNNINIQQFEINDEKIIH